MTYTPHILFLDAGAGGRALMAAAWTRQLGPKGLTITAAQLQAEPINPLSGRVMEELGLALDYDHLRELAGVDISQVDLIITLAPEAAAHCVVLPGAPVVLRWNIVVPGIGAETTAAAPFRALRDEIRQHLVHFFAGNYLPTLLSLKRHGEMVLDHLADGIIVHDTQRIIRWFNRAAERITGYDRRQVIGQDCWKVFPGGFCRGQCAFLEDRPCLDRLEYPLKISTQDGQEKRAEMSVVALRDTKGTLQGVLASFRDVTEVTHLRHRLKTVQSFHGIIGTDVKMHAVYELIGDLAVSDCSVLITGESGTGKELVANAIHGESRRAGRPFVTVNCGALPEGILESELFGHVRGAFTGAIRDKKGRFELADGGTLFLDEVAELSPNTQVKLLRVLQEGTFERVGGERKVQVDVRIISATNKDLRRLVAQGRFREDLYYRLCVVPVHLPPLRQRRNDIPLLVEHFIGRFGREIGRPLEGISPAALHEMMDYDWPGNIRELQNALQYAFVKCKEGLLQPEHLPPEIISHASGRPLPRYHRRGKLNSISVAQALDKARGNKVEAARILGVGRATLYRFLQACPESLPGKSRRQVAPRRGR